MAETTVAQPCLEGLPPMVLDKIVKDIDYKQIIQMRLVCQNLNRYVENYRPDFNLKYIIVNAITSGFLIHFGVNKENFEKRNYEKTVMSVDGDDEMWTPLETLLLHQKSTLEVLQLNCSLEENIEIYGKILEKIQTILTGQNRQNRQITELDHFNSFDITVDTLKMSHVIMLKEKFAASPTEKSARIRYRNLNQDAEIPEGNHIGDGNYEYPVPNENMRLRLKLDKNSVDIEKELYPRPRANPEFYPVPEI